MSLLISCLVLLFSAPYSSQCQSQKEAPTSQAPTKAPPPEGYERMDTDKFKSANLPQAVGSKVQVGCTFKNGKFSAPKDPDYSACMNEAAGKDLFNPPQHSNPSDCTPKRVGSTTLFESCR